MCGCELDLSGSGYGPVTEIFGFALIIQFPLEHCEFDD
jgi:hypothetical protein